MQRSTPRRSFLASAATAGGAALLAGCTQPTDSDTETDAATTVPSDSTSPSTNQPTGDDTSTETTTRRVSVAYEVANALQTDYRVLLAELPATVGGFDVTYPDGEVVRVDARSISELTEGDLVGAHLVEPIGVTRTTVSLPAGSTRSGELPNVPASASVMHVVAPVDEPYRTRGVATCHSGQTLGAIGIDVERDEVTIRVGCED